MGRWLLGSTRPWLWGELLESVIATHGPQLASRGNRPAITTIPLAAPRGQTGGVTLGGSPCVLPWQRGGPRRRRTGHAAGMPECLSDSDWAAGVWEAHLVPNRPVGSLERESERASLPGGVLLDRRGKEGPVLSSSQTASAKAAKAK